MHLILLDSIYITISGMCCSVLGSLLDCTFIVEHNWPGGVITLSRPAMRWYLGSPENVHGGCCCLDKYSGRIMVCRTLVDGPTQLIVIHTAPCKRTQQ